MKQTFNIRRQLAIDLRYCYSARRATQNMSASRSLPTIDVEYGDRSRTQKAKNWLCSNSYIYAIYIWVQNSTRLFLYP